MGESSFYEWFAIYGYYLLYGISLFTFILFLIFYLPQDGDLSNSYICLHELKDGTAEKFAVEQDNRFYILKHSNSTEIKLENLTSGSILYFADLKSDPNIWPNTNVEKYYHKELVYI